MEEKKVGKLIKALKNIEASKEIKKSRYLHENGEHPLLLEASLAADDALITKEGQPNFRVFPLLREAGYRVFRGSYDGFGWLTGCIRTKKGILVFG